MSKSKVIVGGSKKNMGNSILLEFTAQAIESCTDFRVERIHHGGESAVAWKKFTDKEFDFYTDSAGTLLAQHLARPWQEVSNMKFHEVAKVNEFIARSPDHVDGRLLEHFGHNSCYVIAMARPRAEALGLVNKNKPNAKISDLARCAVKNKMTFLGTLTFYERADGYQNLCKEYGMAFNVNRKHIIHDFAAAKLLAGEMDVTELYSTDPELLVYGDKLVIFEDDRKFFPPHYHALVFSKSLLAAHAAVEAAVSQLYGKFSVADMQLFEKAIKLDMGLTIVDLRDSKDKRQKLTDYVATQRKLRGLDFKRAS